MIGRDENEDDASDELPATVSCYYSRKKSRGLIGLILIGLAIMVFFSIVIRGWTILWFTTPLIAFLLYELTDVWMTLRNTDPVLVLSSEGITDVRLRIGVIRWSDIVSAKPGNQDWATGVSLRLRDRDTYLSQIPVRKRIEMWLNRLTFRADLVIETSNLDTDRETLALMMQEFAKRH